jgi:hypothetical protein
MSGLSLPYMLGPIVFYFLRMFLFFIFIYKKKGFDARFLLKFSAISCMLICFDSSLCVDRICIHIIKFLKTDLF